MEKELLTLPEVAIRWKLTYRKAYDMALRGDFGKPERRAGRLMFNREAVEGAVCAHYDGHGGTRIQKNQTDAA